MVKDIQHLTYTDRLIALDLPTVKYRQTRGDLIQTYKIIHNIDNIDSQNFFTMTNDNTRRYGELKPYKEFAKTNPRCNFLSFRINNLWNSLHPSTRRSPDLLNFKKAVDSEIFYLKYNHDLY